MKFGAPLLIVTCWICSLGEASAISASDVPSLWTLNDSVMRLESNGVERKIFYKVPRGGLREVGVTDGTLFFQGRLVAGRLDGVAYVFSKLCGALPYQTWGSATGSQIILTGRIPLVNPTTCQQAAFKDDNNVLNLLSVTVNPAVASNTNDSTVAREEGRREASIALGWQITDLQTQINETLGRAIAAEAARNASDSALRQEAQLRRAAEERAQTAESRVEEISRQQSDASTTRNFYIERIPHNSATAGSAFSGLWVLAAGFLVNLMKHFTKHGVGFWREVSVESLAGLISTFLLYYWGVTDDVKLLVVPGVAGVSFAFTVSGIHHLTDKTHHGVA
jgi:hypothetical protein